MPNRYAADPFSRVTAWLARPRSKAVECAEIFACSALLAFGIRALVVEARYIPSPSMLPGLRIGDRLLVEKVSSKVLSPRRGDVVVFAPPGRAKELKNALIKRVVGVAGDRLDFRADAVLVDGRPLREPYVKEPGRYAVPDWRAIGMPGGIVPHGTVFVMGDNRNNSQDSRVFGPVPVSHVIGHPVARFWPPVRIGLVR